MFLIYWLMRQLQKLVVETSIEVSIEAIVTGEPGSAPEGKCVIGDGIETPCKYLIYTDKKLKSKIKKCLEMHQCN